MTEDGQPEDRPDLARRHGRVFNSAETLLVAAARRARAAGYRRLDAYVPFASGRRSPEALELPPSPIPVRHARGWPSPGAALGLGMQYWANLHAYPMNIGGRPAQRLARLHPGRPSLLIILCRRVLGGLLSLFVILQLPGCSTIPVFNHPDFRRASRDGFFLCIEADRPTVRCAPDRLFPPHARRRLQRANRREMTAAFRSFTSSCSPSPSPASACLCVHRLRQPQDQGHQDQTPHRSPASSRITSPPATRPPIVSPRATCASTPWSSTVATSTARSPRRCPGPSTQAVLARGRTVFLAICANCHGPDGYGQGIVARRGFPSPPSYHEARLLNAPVGHLYDVIANGYGAMYPYANIVDVDDRWAVVAYIRALQRSQHATLADVPPDQLANLQREGKP